MTPTNIIIRTNIVILERSEGSASVFVFASAFARCPHLSDSFIVAKAGIREANRFPLPDKTLSSSQTT
jgi:hypothetical protein